MANYINKYTNIEAYNADDGKQYPNVSYLVATDEVKWVKDDPVHIVAVYNVTSTSEATKLLNSNSGITYQIIDGVRQDTVQMNYTFDTLGEHIVKYKLDGTSIIDYVFGNCEGLTSVTIGNSVTNIGDYAFNYCEGLTSVTIGNSVTNIGEGAFNYCEGLISVTIGNSVTSIGYYAFSNCKGLTSVTIPNSVTSIGDYAFSYCSGLTSVTIGNRVTSIGDYAFYDCKGLTSVTIGNRVTSIGESAFQDCNRLTSVTIQATTPPSLGSDAFYQTNNCPIYVPAESVDAYKTATYWRTYASRIQAIPTE